MNKIIYIFILLITLPIITFSKGFKVELQGGLGTYSMSDLKSFNMSILDQIPLPLEQTENFPPYWFFKGSVLYEINGNMSIGPLYSNHSTGSRHSLSDYSGTYYYDDLVQVHSIGLSFIYSKKTKLNLNWGAYIDGGMSFSKAQFTQHLKLNEIEEQQTIDNIAKETGYFVEPGIRIGYPFKIVEPGLLLGYNIPLSGSGLKEEESDQYLHLQNGEKVNTDWNGFRVAFSLTIRLQREN